MSSPSVRCALVAWSCTLFLAGCSVGLPIRPSAPEQLPVGQGPAFPVTDSIINLPIRADLMPFLTAANDERSIPKKFDQWGDYIKTSKGADYKYYAERDDFSMNPSAPPSSASSPEHALLRDWWKGVDRAANVFVSAALRYKIGAKPHSGSAGGSLQCGEGGEWPRRAMLNGGIAVDITPNYGVSASVTGAAVNPIDPCAIGIADLDVAMDVHSKLADVARGGLKNASTHINTISVKSQVEDAWNALRDPIQLNPDTWFLLNVDKVGHRGFSGAGHIVDDVIQLRANPVIVYGAEPPSAAAALPELGSQLAGEGFRVVADAQLAYDELSKLLAERLRGKRISRDDETIVIVNASIFGNGGNQVVIRIDFRGDAKGYAYFVGRPQLNVLTQTIYIGNLHYDHETARLLQNSAEWLYQSNFREFIAAETVLGVTAATTHVRKLLAPVLNRRLSQTIMMEGQMTSVQGIGVFADVNALSVRAIAEGSLNLRGVGGL